MALKTINFFDGYTSGAAPEIKDVATASLVQYATDNGYELAETLQEGSIYFNTTDSVVKYYDGLVWTTIASGDELFTHTNDSTIHFTQDTIDHTVMLNIGNYSHIELDSHVEDLTLHFTESSIDHTAISNIGTYSHSDIDTHIGDAVKHLPAVIGSNGQVATVIAGAVTWATPASAEGAPIGSIVPWIGGYFGNGSNGTFTNVLGNTVANVNALLNSTGWYVCDGAALNDGDSPIFNGASRYLPNLTDERFLQGNTTAGGIGGSNTMLDHTHTHSLTVAAHTHTFSGTTAAGSAHGHGVGTLATAAAGTHSHALPADYGYGGSPAIAWTRANENRSGTVNTPDAGSHTHTITGSTATESAHTHTYSGTTSGASASSISGSVGTGSAATSTNNRPKYLSVFFIMKVK